MGNTEQDLSSDEGIPGRAWLRHGIRAKMIMLGFLLVCSSLPGMTGLGEVAFQGEYLIGFVQAMTGSRVAPGFGVAFVQKMIMLGFLLIFSSLPGMTGLGEVAFHGEYLIGFV